MKLDILKIVASFLVVLFHMASYRFSEGYMQWFPNFADALGRVAVPIFFMISGCNLFRCQRSAKMIYAKSFRRIFCPLVLWSAFYIIYRRIFWLEPFSVSMPNILKTGAFYHLSFLGRLLFLYLIAPVVQKAWSQLGRIEIIVVVICAFLTDNLMQRGYYIFYARDLYPVGYAFLGAFLADECDRAAWAQPSWKKSILSFGIYIACSIGTVAITMYTSNKAQQYLQTYLTYDNLLILVGAVSAFLCVKLMPISISLCSNVGRCIVKVCSLTYGIYLVHPAIIDFIVFQRWMRWFSWDPGYPLTKLSNWIFIILGGLVFG